MLSRDFIFILIIRGEMTRMNEQVLCLSLVLVYILAVCNKLVCKMKMETIRSWTAECCAYSDEYLTVLYVNG